MTESSTSDSTVVPWVSESLRRCGDPNLDAHGVIFRNLLSLRLSSLLQLHLLSDRILEFWASFHWPEPPSHNKDGVQDHREKPRGWCDLGERTEERGVVLGLAEGVWVSGRQRCCCALLSSSPRGSSLACALYLVALG